MKVFLWSIFQRALPLGENLQNRGIQAQSLCVRCKEKETAMHIFFQCPFAIEVWKKIPLANVVHIATSMSFKEAVVAFKSAVCLPPTGITGIILPWICWILWTARNALIFENRQLTIEEVATKGIRLAREWCFAQNTKIKGTEHAPAKRLDKSPHQADSRIPICRTDAAWEKTSNKAGLAWIISNPTDTIIKQGATTQEYVASPIIAEALALRLGIIAAGNLNLTKIKILSDNQTLIRAINNDM